MIARPLLDRRARRRRSRGRRSRGRLFRGRWPVLLATTTGLLVAVVPAAPGQAVSTSVVENWGGYAGPFHKVHDRNRIVAVRATGATDGKALKLQLDARPEPGPRQGVEIASNRDDFRYGTFTTRMRTANCAGQDRPGVVSGSFLYSDDHSDADGNGLPDNDEIDVEVLCGQPEVVYLSLWTDYDELTDMPRQITRAVDVRTGAVLRTCYLSDWTKPCEPLLTGENLPTATKPVAGFNSATQFRSYQVNWQPDRVRFSVTGARGKRILLWDYQGPASRIPQAPSSFRQNVWHTPTWDPINAPAHNQPTASVAAYIDSATYPR